MNQHGKPRTGSIALMLVLVLTLLAGTFAVSITRSAAAERRAELDRQTIRILQSAIDAVIDANLSSETPIRLDVEEGKGTFILIEPISDPDTEQNLRATLYRNDTVIQMIHR